MKRPLVNARRSPLWTTELVTFHPLDYAMSHLYLSLSSGITFWTGPRIPYPVEIFTITIAAAWIHVLVRLVSQQVNRQDETTGPVTPLSPAPSPLRTFGNVLYRMHEEVRDTTRLLLYFRILTRVPLLPLQPPVPFTRTMLCGPQPEINHPSAGALC